MRKLWFFASHIAYDIWNTYAWPSVIWNFYNFRFLTFFDKTRPFGRARTHIDCVKNTGSMKNPTFNSFHTLHITLDRLNVDRTTFTSLNFYIIFFSSIFSISYVPRHSHCSTTVTDVVFYLLIFEFSLCRHSTYFHFICLLDFQSSSSFEQSIWRISNLSCSLVFFSFFPIFTSHSNIIFH